MKSNQNNISLERVIKGMECHKRAAYGEIDEYGFACNQCPYKDMESTCHSRTEGDLISDALDLLKAQEPVKPVLDIDTWKCGNCRHTLEHQELLGDNVLFHEQYNYCPECGRAVKWE